MSNYFKPMAIILGLLLIFPGIFSCGGGSSKKSDQAFKLDVIIENYLEQNNIPSAEVLVTRNGQTEYHRAFGFSYLFLGDLRQTDQPFRREHYAFLTTRTGTVPKPGTVPVPCRSL